MGIFDWPVWSKDISEFPWVYDMEEVCYILEGRAEIISDDGEEAVITSGDLVTFPCGMKCRWKITSPIRKHYDFR
ncbi:cupin [Candidatus Fermentibacteria bacterium]|nr:MAG: cupin [Candidatus Fermentibacteria bacterium]